MFISPGRCVKSLRNETQQLGHQRAIVHFSTAIYDSNRKTRKHSCRMHTARFSDWGGGGLPTGVVDADPRRQLT